MNHEILQAIEQAAQSGRLNLSGKQITSDMLPSEIFRLNNLKWLDLSCNQLTNLPADLGKLENLTWLDLSNNRLSSLPSEIGQLRKLTYLNLENNRLTRLPAKITQLRDLTWLIVNSNQLRTLPAEIRKLQNLVELKLKNNQLTKLPAKIFTLQSLLELDLTNNCLDLKAEILAEIQQPNIILKFIQESQNQSSIYTYEARVLILGEGEVGKTTLAKKLINPQYELRKEPSTVGIEIRDWEYEYDDKKFNVHIWDFSGQEIDHATHQFFLPMQSLYLLIVDNRRENANLPYWLGIINQLGKESILYIIKNEKENRKFDISLSELRGQSLSGSLSANIFSANFDDWKSLSPVADVIKSQICRLPYIDKPVLTVWFRVKSALKQDSRPYILQSEYFRICEDYGINSRKEQLQLSSYLHNLGVCLHFQDNPILKNIVFLNPAWCTNAIYKLLNNSQIKINQARFARSDLEMIWSEDEYNDVRDELLELMIKFQLCSEIHRKLEQFLVPQLLPVNKPDDYHWDGSNTLNLRYEYEFMPRGILHQFIVATQTYIDQLHVWRNGVLLNSNQARAEVIEYYQPYKGEIHIRLTGKGKFYSELLNDIRSELRKIHKSRNVSFEEFIPCNCSTCRDNERPHMHKFSKIEKWIRNGKKEIDCDAACESVDIANLLNERHLTQVLDEEEPSRSNVDQRHLGSGDNVIRDKYVANHYYS